MFSFSFPLGLFQQTLYVYVISIVLTSSLVILLFYAGAFGGADAKALICISFALPSYPLYFFQPHFGFVSPLFPVTTFSNGVFLASLCVLYAVARNLVWKLKTGKKLFEGFEDQSNWRKILTFICAYKINLETLKKRKHLYPVEDVIMIGSQETQRKLLVMPNDEMRTEIVERIVTSVNQGKLEGEVWVSPGLPLLIFITIGFIITLFFGDIVWILLGSL